MAFYRGCGKIKYFLNVAGLWFYEIIFQKKEGEMRRNSIMLICLTILFCFITQAFAEDCSSDGWCFQSSSQGFRNVRSLWGTAPDNVFAIENHGVYHYDGTSWTKAIDDCNSTGHGIWGSSKNDIWIGGDCHYNGLTWSPIGYQDYGDGKDINPGGFIPDYEDMPADSDYLWGSSPNDVYAVGTGYHDNATGYRKGVIRHYDGSLWKVVYVLSQRGIYSMPLT